MGYRLAIPSKVLGSNGVFTSFNLRTPRAHLMRTERRRAPELRVRRVLSNTILSCVENHTQNCSCRIDSLTSRGKTAH